MKYLVTGCAGFVGSNLVDRLLMDGHKVIGIDNFSTGYKKNLLQAEKNLNFSLIEGDLYKLTDNKQSKLLLKTILKNVDTVYHFAANADIRGGVNNPRKDLEQNTIATFNLLEAMRMANVKKIIFASSAAVLGEPSLIPTPENCAIPMQTSFYGASKMACEGLISAYCEAYNFKGYIFRFVSLLGPRYPHGHVIDFVKKLKNNPEQLLILGDGNQKKSYLHIEDCIDAVTLIDKINRKTIKNDHKKCEIYNLGNHEYCKVRDSAAWICEELNLSPIFKYTGGRQGWIGDNPFVFLDIKKISNTGWKPKYSIEKSIRDTASWLNKNI